MADANDNNKERILALKRKKHEIELRIMEAEKDIKTHSFELEFAKDKIENLKEEKQGFEKNIESLK